MVDVTTLIGEQITKFTHDDEEVRIWTESKREFVILHRQSCCENVYLHAVDGDVDDLLHGKVTAVGGDTGYDLPKGLEPADFESYTVTKFWFETKKGKVEATWVGSSNGYYGESADFEEVTR